jgi:hypothetical protein
MLAIFSVLMFKEQLRVRPNSKYQSIKEIVTMSAKQEHIEILRSAAEQAELHFLDARFSFTS